MPHDVDRKGRPPYPYRTLPPGPAVAQAKRARRILVGSALIITAGVAGIMVLIYPSGDDGPAPVAEQVIDTSPFDWAPSPAVSVRPAPSVTSSFTPTPTTVPVTTRRPAPPAVTRTVSPAPPADLNIGATVGLAVAGHPELRLRHRDFIGRVDRIEAGSSSLERADSRFVVRKGLAKAGCVSLESVNYPGYFLRHRNFILRLEPPSRRSEPPSRWDRAEPAELFARDATFCTAPTRDGAAIILESINYPGRALSAHDDGVIGLDEDDPTAFVVRSPL